MRISCFCLAVWLAIGAMAPAALLQGAQQRAGSSWKEAVRALLAEKNYSGAAAILKKQSPREKDNYELENLLGATLERAGRVSEATAAYLRASKLRPLSTTVRLNLALNYVRQGRFDQASSVFTFILKEGPLDQVREPAYQQSPDDLVMARFIEKVPARERDWYELGMLFLRRGRLQGAQAVFAGAANRFPNSAQLQYGLGWSLQEGGRYEAAREAFAHALKLQPSFPEASLRLGYSYYVQGDYVAAARVYEGVLGSHPESYEAHYFLALALGKTAVAGRERAIEHLRKALDLNPRSFDSHVQLGKIFQEMGRLADATQELEQAIRLNPEQDTARYLLAQCYARSGQSNLAAKELEAFERLKSQERVRARDAMYSDLFVGPQSSTATVSERAARFIEAYKAALLAKNYLQIWQWLTPASRSLYGNDPGEFTRIASRVFESPEVRGQLKHSRLRGGKLVAGRIFCEFDAAVGEKMPPLVLIQEGSEWKIDYAFDWTTAGLGYLGAR